jgi:HAD superfamily hydrolase (TIGR01509 family)
VLQRNGTQATDTLIDSIAAEYGKLRRNPEYLFELQYLFEGTKEILEALKQKGIKLVLLTNANPKQNKYLLEKFGISKYFDYVMDDSCLLPEKPNPARPKFILEKFSVKPEDSLIVDDSIAGIQSGKIIGMKTCGVLTGNARKEELNEANANYVLDSVKDLFKMQGFA